MTQRTERYLCTIDMKSADDAEHVENIRRWVKNLNKDLKEFGSELKYYVKLHGRGPRRGVRRYNQSLPLPFAETADVYIYRRYD
jgi:hypothetical protein